MFKACCFLKILLVLSLIVVLGGCEGGKMPYPPEIKAQLSTIPDQAWNALSTKRIYFGHQSVGDNILAGIGDIEKLDNRIQLKISKLEKATTISEPGFYHSYVGRNQDPQSKIQDFAQIIDAGLGDTVDMAFLKLCYIDVDPSTDAAGLFKNYQNTMQHLRGKFPQVVFIHSTMPLVQLQTGPKAWIKRLLGRPRSGADDNIRREDYNRLLVAEYGGKEPVFDLAKVESTHPDGTRSEIVENGRSFHALVPGLTDDGGHLNEAGRQAAAAELLRVLAAIAGRDMEKPR
jgi:hypothetical protein